MNTKITNAWSHDQLLYTHSDSVGTEESGETARSVLDGEGGSVLNIAGRLCAVILVMQHYNYKYIIST